MIIDNDNININNDNIPGFVIFQEEFYKYRPLNNQNLVICLDDVYCTPHSRLSICK